MAAAAVSEWSRRFVLAGAVALVCTALAAVLGLGRRVEVVLALQGFVLLTVFGKSYALVPSYFDRSLAVPRAPAVQFPLSVGGVVALSAGALTQVPSWVTTLGAVAWLVGVIVWAGALGWTVRDNLTGAETGTGDHHARRRPVDRAGNAVVPVVALYLLAGSYELLAGAAGLPTLLGGASAQVSHLLGAGGAALLVLGVGVRLFPRFLVAHPPRALVALILPAGALGPALLAVGLYDGWPLAVGAALEAVAILGFAATYGFLYWRSERERVALQVVLLGMLAGVVTVALAAHLVFVGRPTAVIRLHYRFALLGFLGLTIVGAAGQFYPPGVGEWPGTSDRSLQGAAGLLAGGLTVQVGGLLVPAAANVGELAVLAGAVLYTYLLASAFAAR